MDSSCSVSLARKTLIWCGPEVFGSFKEDPFRSDSLDIGAAVDNNQNSKRKLHQASSSGTSRNYKSQAAVNLINSSPNASRSDLVSSIILHFQDLYNPAPRSLTNMDIFPIGFTLPDHLVTSLTQQVSEAEIRKAIFSSSSSSALGPDGYNFHFYKSGWHIIGPLVIKVVSPFFSKGYIPNGVKATALALIPKHNTIVDRLEARKIVVW
ncbi:hypothetical protein KFK09_001448 [Dendrobium nobile]|uniref:Uncharacterized protein n=1 Tax=Dendrobium nobile TaxID=94219 RepID=A0A8T3C867_DENNO|nr:hypothetical protein KFK09_001448 [Dendrobium nobile]